jgi:hypothetical protein
MISVLIEGALDIYPAINIWIATPAIYRTAKPSFNRTPDKKQLLGSGFYVMDTFVGDIQN